MSQQPLDLFEVQTEKSLHMSGVYDYWKILKCKTHDIKITERGFNSREVVWAFFVKITDEEFSMFVELELGNDGAEIAFISVISTNIKSRLTTLQDNVIRSILEVAFRYLIEEPLPSFSWNLDICKSTLP